MQKITIAIDGYSSCGKSTLAKALAHKLGYNYIDTGAMYRAVTLYALENKIINDNDEINVNALIKSLPKIEVEFELNPKTHNSDVLLNGVDVEREIRTMKVSGLVSKVSAIKEVREKMVALQRVMGKKKAVVMDGRDIGTHVFPKAELKLFMIADPDVRAKRRQDEFSSKGQYFTIEEVEMSLLKRDMADISREESPLTQADDAVILDNSDLSREEQLEFVLKLIADLQFISRDEQAHH
ncbi:MAG: (d)CMP kinase [Bacteroidota bacterium]|nr:(d)CMP kinase [Bacteroidota bacterium]